MTFSSKGVGLVSLNAMEFQVASVKLPNPKLQSFKKVGANHAGGKPMTHVNLCVKFKGGSF